MTRKGNSTCPFWTPSTGNCRVSQDGLFIPLESHINSFCKSSNYAQCQQHRENERRADEQVYDIVAERRRFHRHSGSQEITLIQTDEYYHDSGPQLPAQMIDFSEGGMRLLASEQLDRDATVTCTLGNDFPPHLRSGTARIRWCRPLMNSKGYQAGLAFRDELISKALNSRRSAP